ncbi:hypothetical protein BKG61_00975 [Mycobacterium syngnathidarum]|uniref:Uncharacterized protein n=1 Tax=Mycobacterium syngnathidarum TaxID=1908205 RepID=A0A1S1KRF9_9MYCO|nr:hypothetical protein BKG61_00975 [Mycobacterium syngnathidarum]
MTVRVLGSDAFDDHRQGTSNPHPVLGEVGMRRAACPVQLEQRADPDDAGRGTDALLLSSENRCEGQESTCRVARHDGAGRVRTLVQQPAVGAQTVCDGFVDSHLGVLSVLDVHHGKLRLPGKCDDDVLMCVEPTEKKPAAMQIEDGAVGKRAMSRFGCADGLDGDLTERDPADPQSPPRTKPLQPRKGIDATADRGKTILDGSVSLVGNRSVHLDEQGPAGDAVTRAGSTTRASCRHCSGG